MNRFKRPLALTVLEAISPHGWDNLTLQLGASGLAAAFWM